MCSIIIRVICCIIAISCSPFIYKHLNDYNQSQIIRCVQLFNISNFEETCIFELSIRDEEQDLFIEWNKMKHFVKKKVPVISFTFKNATFNFTGNMALNLQREIPMNNYHITDDDYKFKRIYYHSCYFGDNFVNPIFTSDKIETYCMKHLNLIPTQSILFFSLIIISLIFVITRSKKQPEEIENKKID